MENYSRYNHHSSNCNRTYVELKHEDGVAGRRFTSRIVIALM